MPSCPVAMHCLTSVYTSMDRRWERAFESDSFAYWFIITRHFVMLARFQTVCWEWDGRRFWSFFFLNCWSNRFTCWQHRIARKGCWDYPCCLQVSIYMSLFIYLIIYLSFHPSFTYWLSANHRFTFLAFCCTSCRYLLEEKSDDSILLLLVIRIMDALGNYGNQWRGSYLHMAIDEKLSE